MKRVALFSLLISCSAAHHYPDGSGIEGQLEREIVAMKQHIRDLEAQAETCGETRTPDALYAELHQIFSGTEVSVHKHDLGARVTIPTAYIFSDPGALRLRAESTMAFDLVATALRLHPEYTVTIEGHTSDRSLPRSLTRAHVDHMKHSVDLAYVLMTRFVTDFSIAPDRFRVAGRGPHEPITTNDTTEGQEANERLEITFVRPSATAAGAPAWR